jgi:hypothetical protein
VEQIAVATQEVPERLIEERWEYFEVPHEK